MAAGYSQHARASTFDVSWTGSDFGFWTDIANWSNGAVPNNQPAQSTYYNVAIDRVGGAEVRLITSPVEVLNLTIGQGSQLVLQDPVAFRVSGTETFGPATINNAGTISMPSIQNTQFVSLAESTNITGGGTILMFGTSGLVGTGTVTSNNTIIGYGTNTIGSDNFAFINNGTVSSGMGSLLIDPRASGGLVNNGTLQALPFGTLILTGLGGGSFTNAGGSISAIGTSDTQTARVQLSGNATIVGGTINGNSFGQVVIPANTSATLVDLTNNAEVKLTEAGTLNLVGTIVNNSRIRMDSASNDGTVNIGAGTVTLTGTGSLSGSIAAFGELTVIGSGTLVNGPSHTISGAGRLGNGTLVLRNEGVIDARQDQRLTIVPSPTGTGVFNSGIIRASVGRLSLTSMTMENSGTIDVQSAGHIELGASTKIVGGVINLAPGSTMEFFNSGGSSFTSMSLNNAATISLYNGGTLNLASMTLNNSGTIVATGSFPTLNLTAGTSTLTGGGSVLLGSGRIIGAGTLVNVNNTILGGLGMVGNGSTQFINSGTIASTVTGQTLTIVPKTNLPFVNTGTLVAGSGTLNLGAGTYANSSGTISSFSPVRLLDGARVNGGTLRSSSTGKIIVPAGAQAGLTDVTNTGTVTVESGGLGLLFGTITNNGTIAATSGNKNAYLHVGTFLLTTTLNGNGTISMRAGTTPDDVGFYPIIDGVGTLVNGAAHHIVGGGTISTGFIDVVNAGTISANGLLSLSPGITGMFNNGTIASAPGVIQLKGEGSGIFFNNNGTLSAGNYIELQNGVTVMGGTLTSSATGMISNAPNGHIATLSGVRNNGNLRAYVGSNLIIQGDSVNTGTLLIQAGNATLTIASTNSFENSGWIRTGTTDFGGAGHTRASGTFNNSGTISGFGTMRPNPSLRLNNSGLIESSDGTLTLLGGASFNLANSGVLRAKPGTTLENQALISGSSGSLQVQPGGTFTNGFAMAVGSVQLDGTLNNLATADMAAIAGVGTFINSTAVGTSVVATSVRVPAINISSGSLATRAGGGSLGTSRTTSLSIGTGAWDLRDHDLVVDYQTASPYLATTALIAGGRNGGAWNGAGLRSSAAKDHPTHATALGAVEASEFISAGAGTIFSGQSIDGTTVLVKYTYYGDTDLNGVVDFDDYSRIDAGFNNKRTGWFNGDVDYNGIVDFDDYSLIDLAFNTQSGTLRHAMSYLDGDDRSDDGMDAPSLQLVADHFQQFGNAYASTFLNTVPEPSSVALGGALSVLACCRRPRCVRRAAEQRRKPEATTFAPGRCPECGSAPRRAVISNRTIAPSRALLFSRLGWWMSVVAVALGHNTGSP